MSEFFNISESDLQSAMSDSESDVSQSATVADTPASSSDDIVVPDPTLVPETASESDASPASIEPTEADQKQRTDHESPLETEDKPSEDKPTDEKTPESLVEELDKKLDFGTAPKAFREGMEALKTEVANLNNQLIEARSDSWQNEYFTNPTGFIEKLKETSPTQFNELALPIVTESANNNPTAWADYLIENHWDKIAPQIFGENVSIDYVRSVLDYAKDQNLNDILLDDDERGKPSQTAKLNAPAQAQNPAVDPATLSRLEKLETFERERELAEINTIGEKAFADVLGAMDGRLKEFGLDPLPTDSADQKVWKEHITNTLRRDAVDFIQGNSKDERSQLAKKTFDLMQKHINAKDLNGASFYVPQMKALVDTYVGKVLPLYANQRASDVKANTDPPVDPPKVVTKTAASVPQVAPAATNPFRITSEDIAQASA